MSPIRTIIEKYRTQSFSKRHTGDQFERLMEAYLKTTPEYHFKTIWLWNDFPFKAEFGGQDTGIDLVAKTNKNEYWAVQCKCFDANTTISKSDLDSFLATSSKIFKDENKDEQKFTQRLWIDTATKWGETAEKTFQNQHPSVMRLGLAHLENAPVHWEKLDKGLVGQEARVPKKQIRDHQKTALDNTIKYFETQDRGKLIMACGTGKTYTALKIAETQTENKGLVLFLVPSIALLGQTLREWTADSEKVIFSIAVCSDARVSQTRKTGNDDIESIVDLAFPACTHIASIQQQINHYKKEQDQKGGMMVVFSTYQSIEVVANAQKQTGFEFDLIICDEAHRTTGVSLTKADESAFTKVHDNHIIKAKKRLYMTATPRLYDDNSKSKAAQNNAELCSMDDENLYGQEIYRIGFGEAVEKNLLTDYKVLILTMGEKDIPTSIQNMIADEDNEITSDDAAKLIGCMNAMSKQILGDEGITKATPSPMQRAVAFCQNIKISKQITHSFNEVSKEYLDSEKVQMQDKSKMVSVSSKHIDGSMNASQRDNLLSWLKSETQNNECKVLTNVRCLSEGVDVPSLDAVLFLSARNSQVDVVQSVGRVMRRSEGKQYGYIIIPVVIPSDVKPEIAMSNNERFKVVWSVLNALRAHDDRFNATINKIDLNKKKPDQILIGGASHGEDYGDGENTIPDNKEIAEQLKLQFAELQGVMYAKMVQKVGDRLYWEQWAKDVAQIAENQIARITKLVEEEPQHQTAFENFLKGLKKNINPSISKTQAIEMLAQHLITKPVFEALFEGYSFVQNNPVSKAMQTMMDTLDSTRTQKDTERLAKFYESVKGRASGIDNAEGKQRIIIELYDKFFKTAFPKMVEQLGIVYTPVEVVDFIIHSVNDVLKSEFNRQLSDENVHILDPFTGTGTFITRLLQSGFIHPKDLKRKFTKELHANEIVLLAYYIAAVNIENAYYDLSTAGTGRDCGSLPAMTSTNVHSSTSGHSDNSGHSVLDTESFGTGRDCGSLPAMTSTNVHSSTSGHSANSDHSVLDTESLQEGGEVYTPFEGIVLTDTFQLGETDNSEKIFSDMFPQNSERAQKQKNAPIRVIIGNPPYSIGQKSANDNAQNQKYEKLDAHIEHTYAKDSKAGLNKSLYDAYIKAFRWSSDRLN